MLWTSIMVAGPVLLVTLVIGVLISVLQVATQLQEMTLSFIPKLLGAAFILIALGPWMIHGITEFAVYTIGLIPSLN